MDGKTITPISIITNGDMSQSSLTSSVVKMLFSDNVGIQFDWSGAPVGTLAVQVSLNYSTDPSGVVLNAGTWCTIPAAAFSNTGTYPVPGTTSSPGYLDIPLLSASAIRVVYTKGSGTGTLNVKLISKGV